MKPLPHYVPLSRGPSGYAEPTGVGVPALRTAPPADFDGPGDSWTPEHLLHGETRFSEIVLRPRVTVPAGSNREQMFRIPEKSERTCLVSSSLSAPLRLEPEVK